MLVKNRLLIPGPSQVPPEVNAAMARPIIGHRSGDFAKFHEELAKKLKQIFQTENEVVILTGSGTAAMEASVSSVVNPGDEVLCIVTGKFGERFAELAKVYGANVTVVEAKWGETYDLDTVTKLIQEKKFKLVCATHNETSTGVTNNIPALGDLCRKYDALLLVDAVSSMGGMDIKTDEWNVDLMVSGSQKAFMLPPGLSFVSISPKALEVINNNDSTNYYLSLKKAKKSQDKWSTPYTPNVSLFYALDEACNMILKEGLDTVFMRHKLLAEACQEAVKALGLNLLAKEEISSYTVTAFTGNVDTEAVRSLLKKKFGFAVAGGQDSLKGKIIRIGHMGYMDFADLFGVIAALELCLKEVGYPVELGKGVGAAMDVFYRGGRD
ncbi:MAG: alanine--glyoxylate aminotransferase family protein [Firmicutes bacterium]|nr:alanine--glyoxylate aminotransferase family protein [Bacillota bacterium]MDD4262904.1 alanine--glyoxylate aminotransferase family protein [Bacillota bacterium]MDD4693049.1 alanine--glyoxylate aminotransferase family protein [Bacillota bacterium]